MLFFFQHSGKQVSNGIHPSTDSSPRSSTGDIVPPLPPRKTSSTPQASGLNGNTTSSTHSSHHPSHHSTHPSSHQPTHHPPPSPSVNSIQPLSPTSPTAKAPPPIPKRYTRMGSKPNSDGGDSSTHL